MRPNLYRYHFRSPVDLFDVEATLVLALFAAESLHGETQVRMDAQHFLDADQRACVIDARTSVGQDLNRLFLGFVSREYPPADYHVDPIYAEPELAKSA